MHPVNLRTRGATVMALLGTASFLTIAGTVAAEAQAQGNAPVEEVLVTGSLIRGAPSVGVPVTALSDADFKETGALTVADMMKSIPALVVSVATAVTNGGGVVQKPQTVSVHGIASGTGTETLLMINGMRYPTQGFSGCYVDPSIIPQLAVDHIDVLADGASATYGSDAVVGVINVIMKRGFEGAISQVRYARSWDIGDANYQASQLYGTKWNSGDVTLTYEWYHEDNVYGLARPYFTLNFEPYGYDDKTGIGVSMPGVFSTGAFQTVPALAAFFSATSGSRACANCYSIPAGTGWNYGDTPAHTNPTAPGSAPTTSWTTLLANAGVKNLRNPALDADVLPVQDRNAATITFDQDLIYGVRVFADGFYSNRRAVFRYLAGASPSAEQALRGVAVPTTNPYYPAGAPAGLLISYDMGVEHPSRVNSGELAERYSFGFTDDTLPFDWHGRLYYSMSQQQGYVHVTGMLNTNMVLAALGNLVPSVPASRSTPGQAAFVKPANIPYLNLFCDATQFKCNSQITEDYIGAYRDYDEKWLIGETGVNLDGPVTELPGGTLRAALGANYVSSHCVCYVQHSNFGTAPNTSVPVIVGAGGFKTTVWAVYGQLNVPIIGEMNKIPLVEGFTIEVAARYDRYYNLPGVTTPKLAATWTVGHGLSLRGTVGKAFRAPAFSEYSYDQSMIQPTNTLAGASTNTFNLSCPKVAGQTNSPTQANANTLNAYLNPGCANTPALRNPGGIALSSASGAAAAIRLVTDLSPEKSKNWSFGFDFKPTEFLSGLDVDVTWYHVRIENVIGANGGGITSPNDPLGTICTAPTPYCQYIVRANPNLPITDPVNATFLAMVNGVVLNPRSFVPLSAVPDIQFIQDTANVNQLFRQIEGLDFNARYDFDLGDWGAWNTGVSGNFQLQDKSQIAPIIFPVVDSYAGNQGGRLHWRGRVGWTATGGMADGLSVTAFVNFIPHGPVVNTAPPACYWGVGFSAGSCYPGSPYSGPFTVFPNTYPGLYTFDLSMGYQTGDKPANTYLQNINLQLAINNLFNKAPPFNYATGSGRGLAGYISAISPLQRTVSFSLTKNW